MAAVRRVLRSSGQLNQIAMLRWWGRHSRTWLRCARPPEPSASGPRFLCATGMLRASACTSTLARTEWGSGQRMTASGLPPHRPLLEGEASVGANYCALCRRWHTCYRPFSASTPSDASDRRNRVV